MSLFRIHLKKLVCRATNKGLFSSEGHLGFFVCWFRAASCTPWNPVAYVKTGAMVTGVRLHCTAAEEPRDQPIANKKNNNAKRIIGNVGRLIPYNVIQVINENGEDLGKMSKKNVIQIMEERDLKLVLLREKADPPVYRLMTGKQLFEKQTELREKQKHSGSSCIQLKEMSFFANIEKHDLDVKKKQLSEWIQKKHNVKISILNSRAKDQPDRKDVLQDVLESLQNQAIFSSEPKELKDGKAVVCVLRPLSQKELQKQKKDLEQQNRTESNHTEDQT